jgi:hypothetical protein
VSLISQDISDPLRYRTLNREVTMTIIMMMPVTVILQYKNFFCSIREISQDDIYL